jgi:hypothetical protein
MLRHSVMADRTGSASGSLSANNSIAVIEPVRLVATRDRPILADVFKSVSH